MHMRLVLLEGLAVEHAYGIFALDWVLGGCLFRSLCGCMVVFVHAPHSFDRLPQGCKEQICWK